MAQTGTARRSPWKTMEDRARERDQKREAVLNVAARLFIEQGYDRATMNEVAERLNITKPALYNYFAGKEDILLECYRLGQTQVEESFAEIEREGGSGLARLRSLICSYISLMADDFGKCLVRIDDQVLPPERRAEVRAGKRRIDAAFRKLITDGIADGSICPCDPKLAAFAIAGAINWTGHWFRLDGEYGPERVGEEFAARLTDGLAAGGAVRPPQRGRPHLRSAGGSSDTVD